MPREHNQDAGPCLRDGIPGYAAGCHVPATLWTLVPLLFHEPVSGRADQ